jgi:hypothetical protein
MTPCVRHGVKRTIIRWIISSLEGWQAITTLGGLSRNVTVTQGCPQVGVLSPLLWCLVVDELLTRLTEGGVYAQGYVDDICILAVEKFPNTLSGLTQWALHAVEVWCDKLSSSVNPNKTGLVTFTRRRNLPGFFELRLYGKILHRCGSVK